MSGLDRMFLAVFGGLGLAFLVLWAVAFLFGGPTCGGSNDTAAIASLRNLATVQDSFRDRALVDLDDDGAGEYGFFQEMTGAAGLRASPDGTRRAGLLSPLVLSPIFAPQGVDGRVRKAGYEFRIFLPSRGGGAAFEAGIALPFRGVVDTEGAEARWCAYAWPWNDDSGRRTLFVDDEGEVFQAATGTSPYVGPSRVPAFDAAFFRDGTVGWGRAGDGQQGRDGNVWKRVK